MIKEWTDFFARVCKWIFILDVFQDIIIYGELDCWRIKIKLFSAFAELSKPILTFNPMKVCIDNHMTTISFVICLNFSGNWSWFTSFFVYTIRYFMNWSVIVVSERFNGTFFIPFNDVSVGKDVIPIRRDIFIKRNGTRWFRFDGTGTFSDANILRRGWKCQQGKGANK